MAGDVNKLDQAEVGAGLGGGFLAAIVALGVRDPWRTILVLATPPVTAFLGPVLTLAKDQIHRRRRSRKGKEVQELWGKIKSEKEFPDDMKREVATRYYDYMRQEFWNLTTTSKPELDQAQVAQAEAE